MWRNLLVKWISQRRLWLWWAWQSAASAVCGAASITAIAAAAAAFIAAAAAFTATAIQNAATNVAAAAVRRFCVRSAHRIVALLPGGLPASVRQRRLRVHDRR